MNYIGLNNVEFVRMNSLVEKQNILKGNDFHFLYIGRDPVLIEVAHQFNQSTNGFIDFAETFEAGISTIVSCY